MRRSYLVVLLLAIAALATAPLFAQNVTAKVNGTVRDATGAVIVNATVKLVNDATGATRAVQTNADGYFSFTDAQVGSYSLNVEMRGFKSYRQQEIKLSAGQNRTLGDISLPVGDVAESVTVEATVTAIELGSDRLLTDLENLATQFGSMPALQLHTVGRVSGKRRSVMLTAPVHDDGCYVLVASKGGDDRDPDWYRNLVANPEVELTVQGTTIPMTARTATARC